MLKSEAILKLVRHLLLPVLVLAAANLPACAIYDEELLEDAFGGTGVTTSGGSTGGGNVTGGSGGTGGGITTGGSAPGGGMGGEMTGGASGGDTGGGDTGGAPTGGATGGTGGNGTGGGAACIDAPGAFTGLGTTKELDSFDADWPLLTSEVTAWHKKGYWSGAGDAGVVLADSLIPQGDSVAWEPGKGYAAACEDEGFALHISATGSDSWGVSFAAQFNAAKTDVDLSAYDGVVFWARSENKSLLKVAYATAAAPNVDIGTEPVSPLTTKWVQQKMAFPTVAAFDPLEVALLKFIGVAPNGGDGTVDVWIDNVTFYAEPAE